ncbi:MAG TPA: glycerol-3-phosphate dehydrogenase/oxidase [Rhizomicrobium sp.]|jgi:glycerol-3-phosphate dehydrogenase
MRRDLNRLASDVFDLLVIGGGITGAAIARDASLRGLNVALVERNDFAHATSAHNSKLIHGGLRYLRNFELGLVRESLRERRIWQRIAPHLVRPLPFLLPVLASRAGSRGILAAGLTLYDFLAFDRGRLDDPDQRLPGHSWLGASAARACEPILESLPLAGAFQYFDAQMYAPERLALECVLDAAENGAVAANHVGARALLLRENRVCGASLVDLGTEEEFDVRASLTVIAAGPWTDVFLSTALRHNAHGIRRSKGIHLVVPALVRGHALTIAAGDSHFFVLPWRSGAIVGTTDTAFEGPPDSVSVTETDIDEFLGFINSRLPGLQLTRDRVRHSYAGLRPLADSKADSTYAASRRAELIDHEREDGPGALLSVIGGKWTTSRALAESTVDAVVRKLGKSTRPCTTARRRLPGGALDRLCSFNDEARRDGAALPNPDHLARLYGSRFSLLLGILETRPDLGEALSPSGDIGAQILLAVREEMALSLEDTVMRRTGIGQEGDPGPRALDRAATIMGSACGWSEARRRAEIDRVKALFRESRV